MISDRMSVYLLTGSVYCGIFIALASVLTLPGAAFLGDSYLLLASGMVLMVIGIGLRRYAISVLRASFTYKVATHHEQTVVDSGPYRWVRHPSYAGSLITIVGFLVACSNLVSLMAVVPVAVGYAYRISVEERALCTAFGGPYRDYMQRIPWRLVPHVL